MVRIDSNEDLVKLPSRESEIARAILNLKQRMDPSHNGRPLVDSLKVEFKSKEEPNYKIDKKSLNQELSKISNFSSFPYFMEYQVQAWDFINKIYKNEESRALIVSAPTGFGKTEAVIPAVLNHISNSDGIAILIFPRRALLLDQLNRLSKYNFNNETIRIGIQFDGIDPKLTWTVYEEEQTNISLNARNSIAPKKIDPLKHWNYYFETELLKVNYISNTEDRLKLKVIKCQCGGDLFLNFYFRPNIIDQNKGIRSQNTEFLEGNPDNTSWKCEKCNRIYSISLSREDHKKLKPNLIFTTIDSLPSLFYDPDIRDHMRGKTITIVLDEIHVYHGLYGAHAATILSQIANPKKIDNKFVMIGLSATIDKPQEFGRKIFGKDTFVIFPTNNDKKNIENAETYYFIKSSSDQRNSGEFYTLKPQTMIQFGLLSISSIINEDKKMLTFIDSIEGVSLLKAQIQDAYNNKILHYFRLDNLISKKVKYKNVSCTGLNPGHCESDCLIYKEGECWNILRHYMNVKTPQKISIMPVTSLAVPNRTTLMESSIIFSTSELELGIDLPNVIHLVQYGAPFTIFSFLQRKGRAGRNPGERPNFYFILGDKSNDFLYFSYGTEILNKAYRLPVNPENRIIKEIHKLLNETYDETLEKYREINTNQTEEDYVKKYKATWLAILEKISRSFAEFLSNIININVLAIDSIKSYKNMVEFKDQRNDILKSLKQQYQRKLSDYLIEGLSPLNYLEKSKQNLLKEISSSQIEQNEKDRIINDLKEAIFDVEIDIETSDQTQKNLEKVKEHQNKLLDLLHKISKDYIGEHLGEVASDFYGKVMKVASKQQNLVNNQQELRKMFFWIQTLEELEKAINRTLFSEIIKYIFRAQHFYELSEKTYDIINSTLSNTISPLPPTNYFSTSSREVILFTEIISTERETKEIKEIIYKYLPFRLNESKYLHSKIVVLPKIEKNNDGYRFETSEFLDGIFFKLNSSQETFLLPLTIKTNIIRVDEVNGIVSFCKDCLLIQDFDRKLCKNCGKSLSKVRAYASPIVDSKINDMKSTSSPVPNMKFGTSTDVVIALKGVELYLRYQRYDESLGSYMPLNKSEKYLVNASLPYGYMINTHSIEIKVSQNKVDYLMKLFEASNKNRKINKYVVLHTIAHLWIKTISMSTGITDEFFVYRINDNESDSSVLISEIQEGGAGFLEIFTDLISNSTKDILDNMYKIVNCEEHNKIFNNKISERIYHEMRTFDFSVTFKLSDKERIVQEISNRLNLSVGEVEEHFPVCYDGCPYCIGLSGCEEGVEEQFDSLSLMVAKSYVESIVIRTNDRQEAAKLIENGGVMIDYDGKSYGIFLL